MKIIWSPRARSDRMRIFQHIVEDNFSAAGQLDQSFDILAIGLLAFPQQGRPGRLKGTRELVAHPNYIMVYRLRPSEIEIVRIIHAAQRWP